MCKIERICFSPVFLFLIPFPKAKVQILHTTKQSTDSLLHSRKYLLKQQEKHFISERDLEKI